MQSSIAIRHAETPTRWRRPAWLRSGLLWFAFDLLVPTALLYVLLWRGSSLYVALLAPASVSAVTALISYRRGTANRRRVDRAAPPSSRAPTAVIPRSLR